MNRCFIQQLSVFLFFGLLLSCSLTNNKPLLIGFSADSSAIVFNQIDQAGLTRLRGAGLTDSTFRNLVSVLEMPAELDTTFKERAVDGTFQLTDSNLVFIPDSPFVKGRNYLVITYLNSKFGDMKAILKAELSTGIQPIHQELIR